MTTAQTAEQDLDQFAKSAAETLVEKPEDKAQKLRDAKALMRAHKKEIRDERAKGVYHKRVSREKRTYLNLGSFFVNAAGVAGLLVISFGSANDQAEAANPIDVPAPAEMPLSRMTP